MKNNTLDLNNFIWNELKALQNFQRKNIEMFDSSDEKYGSHLSLDDDIFDKKELEFSQSGGN